MHHTVPIASQFYVTASQPCPYLTGRVERKLFTSLQGIDASILNNTLSKQGFRRSQNVLYRPACVACTACLSARIDVQKFEPSKSQRRILRRNASLQRLPNAPWATEKQYDLFRSYLNRRHATGGMVDMDIFEFAAMIEETPVTSRVMEYTTSEGNLNAVCLTDVFDDGLSLVYSFFETSVPKNSIGTYMILDHIKIAKEAGLPYVYLGYWVQGSDKMAYKTKFSGVEVFRNQKWAPFDPSYSYETARNPLAVSSISEQVAQISMPNMTHIDSLDSG
jgi:arginyl-tRNA--protein-N-Asp/Glu arginylyltransferase